MYRASSPYQPPPQDAPRAYSPIPGVASILPGTVTYTTTVGPDGRSLYQLFEAVPASYQTSSGIVTGIQWVSRGASPTLPPGAQPATAEFAASWNRGQVEDERFLNNWEREEDKRRRKDQSRAEYDADLRKARERDAQARERRKSISASASPGSYPYPSIGNTGYPGTAYPLTQYSGYGDRPVAPGGAPSYPPSSASGPYSHKHGLSDMERHFGDLDLDRGDRDREYERERRTSRPSKYNPNDAAAERTRTISGNLGPRPGGYDGSGTYGPSGPYNSQMRSYSGSGPPHTSPNMRAASPSPRERDAPYVPTSVSSGGYPGSNYSSSPAPRALSESIGRSTTPFGAGAPPAAYPRSRPASPMPVPTVQGKPIVPAPAGPYSASSVAFPQGPNMPAPTPIPADRSGMPAKQLAAPAGFSRPVNGSNAFAPFDITKIQDMEKFWTDQPRMPLVLKSHDVYEEDWKRLMQDIALAWAGQLPVLEFSPTGQKPKRSGLIKELVELWNNAFFNVRRVELILYKGRERQSGPQAGRVDKDLPQFDDANDYSPSSSASEETDDSDSDFGTTAYRNVYNQSNPQQPLAGVFEAGRLRKEAKIAAKAERKRKRHEKHRRRRERKYSLYLSCLSGVTTGSVSHMSAGMPGGPLNPVMPYTAVAHGYGTQTGMPGRYPPAGY